MKMDQMTIFKVRAEAEAKHLFAKLNEAEAEALENISKSEKKINELNTEIETCKKKKEVLEQKLNKLKNADEDSWEELSKEFVEFIETLEDKSVFRSKTEEWFKTIRNIAGELKENIKEKAAQW